MEERRKGVCRPGGKAHDKWIKKSETRNKRSKRRMVLVAEGEERREIAVESRGEGGEEELV